MFSKKTLMFNNKLGMFLRNIKVFLQHSSASCLFVKCVYVRIGLYTYGDTSLHVRTHEPVHTVA